MHIVHLTSVHEVFNTRLFHRKCRAAIQAGYAVTLVGPHSMSCKVDGVQIISVRKFGSKILRMTLTAFEVFRKALRIRCDLYHVEDPELLPWALMLRILTGTPVVYDAKEYHRSAILWKEYIPKPVRGLIAGITERIEKTCARGLDGVIVVNPHMKSLFDPYCREVAVVHNFPWQSSIPAVTGPRDPQMIIFVGAISRERGYELLLHSLEFVRRQDADAYCLFVGSILRQGAEPSALEREKELIAQGALRLVGTVEYEEMWKYLCAASVGWIPFLKTPNNDLGLPNKLFEYMAAAVPVVASNLRFLTPIITQTQCGILVPADEPSAHADALLTLLRSPEIGRQMGERGKMAIQSRYNWESEANTMLALYERLLIKPSKALEISSKANDEPLFK